MALYAIGDTHLSLSNEKKAMDVFGGRWTGYVDKLREGFQVVQPSDTVVLCGDLSWGMSLEEARADLAFLNALPGRKILLKGNHDFWWTTASKMNRFFEENGFRFELLHNSALPYEDKWLCGTRGWFLEQEQSGNNEKLRAREAQRLELSLRAAGAGEKLVFLHYPPLYQGYRCPELLEVLRRWQVRRCCFAHLHGASVRLALQGEREGTDFTLVSADSLNFVPRKLLE
jgi:predicted phosphohydrolase